MNRFLLVIVIIVCAVAVGLFFIFQVRVSESENDVDTEVRGEEMIRVLIDRDQLYHQLAHYNEDLFYEGLLRFRRTANECGGPAAGGIVPHHLLAGDFIAMVFQCLATQNPDTVVIIAPNHSEAGSGNVLTSKGNWGGREDIVYANQLLVDELVDRGIASIDESTLGNEHAVTLLIPFIEKYLPGTTVVPIVLKSGTRAEEVETIAKYFSERINTRTAVVASVDFSHYVDWRTAEINDSRSLDVIRSIDYRQALLLGHDYMDSPVSVASLLLVMRNIGMTNVNVLGHTNSAHITGQYGEPVTSYFSITFHK